MEESKENRVISNLVAHISQAYVHYEHAFNFQFRLALYKIPVWGKKDMWEHYYYPVCDELQEMCDRGMFEYLETLR